MSKPHYASRILDLSAADSGVLLDGGRSRSRSTVGSVHDVVSANIAARVDITVVADVVVVVVADIRSTGHGNGTSLNVARAVAVSGALMVGVVLLHENGNLGLAHDGLGDLLGNSPDNGDNLVTVLGDGLLDGDGLGNLNSAGDLHGALLVNNLGHGHLNLLDLVGANGDANGVGHHDGLGNHHDLVNIADGGDLDLLGDGLINRPVGDDGAGDFDGLDIIHGVLNLLSGLAGDLDGLRVMDNFSPEGLDFLGTERSVGLLDSVLLRNVGVNGAGDLLGDGDSAGGNAFATVVVGIGDDGAVSASGNRTVWLGH